MAFHLAGDGGLLQRPWTFCGFLGLAGLEVREDLSRKKFKLTFFNPLLAFETHHALWTVDGAGFPDGGCSMQISLAFLCALTSCVCVCACHVYGRSALMGASVVS